MTFSELRTVCFEAANLINERPIGRNLTSLDDESYLCPNDLTWTFNITSTKPNE